MERPRDNNTLRLVSLDCDVQVWKHCAIFQESAVMGESGESGKQTWIAEFVALGSASIKIMLPAILRSVMSDKDLLIDGRVI